MYSCGKLFLCSLESYFSVSFPRCFATREINTKITLSWALKQFVTRVYTLFSIYCLTVSEKRNVLLTEQLEEINIIRVISIDSMQLLLPLGFTKSQLVIVMLLYSHNLQCPWYTPPVSHISPVCNSHHFGRWLMIIANRNVHMLQMQQFLCASS